jgi:hypothetical protein
MGILGCKGLEQYDNKSASKSKKIGKKKGGGKENHPGKDERRLNDVGIGKFAA